METSPAPDTRAAGCLVVTGMHRSGTSILASLLRAAGVNLGEISLPADGASPLASCEDSEFRELQREMLLACTMAEGGWRDWGWTESQRLDFSRLPSFRPKAEALLRKRHAATRPWGWEDPRTTILLDFWDEILADARYIFIYSAAWEVAASLAALHRSPFLDRPAFVPRIWCFYNRQLLDFYRRHQDRCLLIELASLLSRPHEVLALVRSKLGLPLEEPQDGAAMLRGTCGEGYLGAAGSTANLWRLSARIYPREAQVWAELEQAADLPAGRNVAAEPTPDRFDTRSTAQGGGPTSTIVIPCFNHGEFVLAAVASAEDSAGVPFELVIVNDGSTDPFTIEILEGLRAAGYRILDQPNRGLSAARNAGIRAARGRYILPLDADNRIRPSYLRRAAEVLDAAPEVGVVYGDAALFGTRGGPWRMPEFDLEEMASCNLIDACAVFRREVWEQSGGYDENLRNWEDWDYWLSVAEAGWKFVHVPEVLFEYRVQSESLSSGLDKAETRRRALELITAKHAAIFQPRLPKMFAERDALWMQAEARAALLDRSLDETRGDLETTRRDLQATRDELQGTRSELNAARSELQAARSELLRFGERLEFMTGTRAWRVRSGLLRWRAALGLQWRA